MVMVKMATTPSQLSSQLKLSSQSQSQSQSATRNQTSIRCRGFHCHLKCLFVLLVVLVVLALGNVAFVLNLLKRTYFSDIEYNSNTNVHVNVNVNVNDNVSKKFDQSDQDKVASAGSINHSLYDGASQSKSNSDSNSNSNLTPSLQMSIPQSTMTTEKETETETETEIQTEKATTLPMDASASMTTVPHKTKHHPTFLWGIPSVIDDTETRQAVRETYLRFYKDLGDNERICSLLDIIERKTVPLENCQIAYVFFVGGNNNPHAPTELVHPNSSFPMTLNSTQFVSQHETNDVIVLNIKENLEDGKSQTWFKYASIIIQEYQYPFDYVAKVDSDTLLFVPAFLEFANQNLPPKDNLQRPVQRIYSGVQHTNTSCDPEEKDSPHPCPLYLVGDMYMAGALYFMSADLAAFIASDAVDRANLTIRHEDADIGNFVFTHPQPVTPIIVHRKNTLLSRFVRADWTYMERSQFFDDIYWAHSETDMTYWPGPFFKDKRNFRKVWKQFQGWWVKGRKFKKVSNDIFILYDLPEYDGASFVRINDYIYSDQDFDSSPIVVESHKLIFFTVTGVADTTWRCLFRRMAGFQDWKDPTKQFEGLNYLRDYPIQVASQMMQSPEYTRAIFVRDPKIRLASNYLEYVVKGNGQLVLWSCCGGEQGCIDKLLKSFEYFMHVITECDAPYFRPQGRRMEPRYYDKLTFVGNYATLQRDAQQLLEQLNVWDFHGRTGWGDDGSKQIFHDAHVLDTKKFKKFYPTTEIEKKAQKLFKMDYDNPVLKLRRKVQMDRSVEE